jgi:hypothetical protein
MPPSTFIWRGAGGEAISENQNVSLTAMGLRGEANFLIPVSRGNIHLMDNLGLVPLESHSKKLSSIVALRVSHSKISPSIVA